MDFKIHTELGFRTALVNWNKKSYYKFIIHKIALHCHW